MNYSDHMYISKQIQPVRDSAKNSKYPATIVLSHDGTKTKTLNVSNKQLEEIRKILLTDQ